MVYPFPKKDKDLPPAKMSTAELDELLRDNFDGEYLRKRGIPKDFCERINGVPTVEEDGTEVCTVLTYKNPETPEITFARKIKLTES